MSERVVEILVFIMSEMRGKNSGLDRLEFLSNDLIQRGYTQHEISFAFSWLFERYKSESEELMHNNGATLEGSCRILHEAERTVITPKAYGYLLQLRRLGIMNDVEMEHTIERALMVGVARITETEIKSLVATMLFSPEGLTEKSFHMFEDNSIIH